MLMAHSENKTADQYWRIALARSFARSGPPAAPATRWQFFYKQYWLPELASALFLKAREVRARSVNASARFPLAAPPAAHQLGECRSNYPFRQAQR